MSDIILDKYEIKGYTKDEEERAMINILEDLNNKYEEIGSFNQLLKDSRMATMNILDDSLSLNKQIKEDGEKTKAILQNMSDGLYVVNLKEEIILFNQAAEKMFGWASDEVVGKKDSDIFSVVRFANVKEPDKGGLSLLAHTAWKSGKMIKIGFLALPRKSGEDVIVSISVAPIYDEAKNVAFGVVVLHDMKHEFDMDRAKTEFVSVASHQLRTPLAAIKWFVELLVSGDAGKITKQQLDFLTQISESTERMIDLVNSLLNVSRIETGRMSIDPKPTNLIELAEKVVREVSPLFEKRKQKFKFSKPTVSLPDFNIDPKLIFEAIINLLTNSSKYTLEEGEISLSIDLVGEEAMIKIVDNGLGIPVGQQNRVFNKFFRGENVLRQSPEGTGLGLYIVKAIVESSGGRIWFDSQEGRGTTFYFTLPIKGSPEKKGDVSIEMSKSFI